nr:MAG TPA: CI repressor [Caudoviricetes sp.]
MFCGDYIIVRHNVLVNTFSQKGGIIVGTPKFTEFGLCVKKRLLDLGMTQKELEQIVSERTGLFVDAGYMYKILSGQREAPKISEAIREVLEIDTA